MPRRLYVDTSAYLCVLLGERESSLLEREFADADLLSSVVLVLEASRNLVRLSREGLLSPEELHDCLLRVKEDQDIFLLRDLTVDLCSGWTMPVVSTPRSLDLAHLRTALWFHEREPLARFVSLDEAQNRSARELGLPTD